MSATEQRGLVYVALAVAFLSTSPVLIVWADPMPSIVKTTGRLFVAAVVVGVLAHLTGSALPAPAPGVERRSDAASALRFAGYGLVTSLHFLFYVASLEYTTAAHALAIIYTAPIIVTLLSAVMLHEPIKRRQWLGVSITVLGVAVLAGLEPQMTPRMAFGDLLALLSSVTYAFYSVAGRYERARYPLLTYAWRVYGAATLWLLPAALLVIPTAPAGSWGLVPLLSVLALGIGPHALGHTLYNASLRRVHATYVNIIASQEVTGGIILALLVLGQVPSLNAVAGAIITLVGIAFVLR